MRRLFCTVVCAVIVAALLPSAAQALTFDRAVDRLVRSGYPQKLEKTIVGFRSTSLGFRWTGSPADDAAARYIAAQMRAAGLRHVRLEAVPVDEWAFKGASVKVGSRVMNCSSYPGVPPTGTAGVTGQVVAIPNSATAADFDAAGDISGKIALVNFDSADWWFNFPCAEAGLRGAKAVILTYSADYPGYHGQPGAYGSNDPGYSFSSPPLVWLPSGSADWLKARMAAGPVTAAVTVRSRHTLAADGGRGYNVVGEYPGSGHDGKAIVFGSHHDSHFTGAIDNTAACVANLTIAKAMQRSGYRPAHKIIFLSTTAEEWGYTNCNYDWLVGSTYSITHTNRDWAGNVLVMLNMELPGYKRGAMWFTATQELKPWLEAEIAAHPELVGPKVAGDPVQTPDESLWFSYNDQWPLAASGIPTACSWTADDNFWANFYHTDFDNITQLDYRYLGKNVKFEFELAHSIDRGVLPYDLSAQASALTSNAGGIDFAALGLDKAVVHRFVEALTAYKDAADGFESLRSNIPTRDVANVNSSLLAIERKLNSSLIGLNVWDATIYPYEQSVADLAGLQSAVAALGADPVDYAGALTALDGVGLSWYGTAFSYPVYLTNLLQRDPEYYHANMAAMGHMPWLVDVMPDYREIEAAQAASIDSVEAIASLQEKAGVETSDVQNRLQSLSATLGSVSHQIQAVTPPAAR